MFKKKWDIAMHRNSDLEIETFFNVAGHWVFKCDCSRPFVLCLDFPERVSPKFLDILWTADM